MLISRSYNVSLQAAMFFNKVQGICVSVLQWQRKLYSLRLCAIFAALRETLFFKPAKTAANPFFVLIITYANHFTFT